MSEADMTDRNGKGGHLHIWREEPRRKNERCRCGLTYGEFVSGETGLPAPCPDRGYHRRVIRSLDDIVSGTCADCGVPLDDNNPAPSGGGDAVRQT